MVQNARLLTLALLSVVKCIVVSVCLSGCSAGMPAAPEPVAATTPVAVHLSVPAALFIAPTDCTAPIGCVAYPNRWAAGCTIAVCYCPTVCAERQSVGRIWQPEPSMCSCL